MNLSKEHAINLGLISFECQGPSPRKDEAYEEYLDRHGVLGRGFNFGELVKPRRKDWRGRYRTPPARMWSRMVPTLALANELRLMMREGYPDNPKSARGLRVAAAYRPTGGATYSQHKVNAALDLDLLPTDYDQTRSYYETAVRLWCEYGRDMQMGLGLYCSSGARGGIRVHIDTGYSARCWQIWRGRSIRPHGGKSLATHLAHEMGLLTPVEQ